MTSSTIALYSLQQYIHSNLLLIFFNSTLKSCVFLFAIFISRGPNSNRARSSGSSNHDFIRIPFSGYNWKFSLTLSTIIILDKGLPNLTRSYIIQLLSQISTLFEYHADDTIWMISIFYYPANQAPSPHILIVQP